MPPILTFGQLGIYKSEEMDITVLGTEQAFSNCREQVRPIGAGFTSDNQDYMPCSMRIMGYPRPEYYLSAAVVSQQYLTPTSNHTILDYRVYHFCGVWASIRFIAAYGKELILSETFIGNEIERGWIGLPPDSFEISGWNLGTNSATILIKDTRAVKRPRILETLTKIPRLHLRRLDMESPKACHCPTLHYAKYGLTWQRETPYNIQPLLLYLMLAGIQPHLFDASLSVLEQNELEDDEYYDELENEGILQAIHTRQSRRVSCK